jgi:hypothetical protein
MRPMPRLALWTAILILADIDASRAEKSALPAEFVRERIILTPTLDGHTVRFFTDTGGGWNAIAERTVAKLGLEVVEVGDGESKAQTVEVPRFDALATIPAPLPLFMEGRLFVARDAQLSYDGFLGGRWFADRIWEMDYPRQRFAVLSDGSDAPVDCVPLGFQVDQDGRRTMHFPSIDVEVDGETLPMLFDTAATASITASAADVFAVAPGEEVGTSFIERAVFERWRLSHPEWRVLDAADQMGGKTWRMIEVPTLTIAGLQVGPVWFAERSPGAFQEYMASMMDRPTWGALGGSALKYFRVVVDYPNARACFAIDADPMPVD